MHYKDSIIKVNVLPKVKQINDGKQDVMVVIPLTDILDKQARASFLLGLRAYSEWVSELALTEDDIDAATSNGIDEKLKEWLDDVH